MAIDSLVQPLRRVTLFQGLRPLQITEIARRAERIVYRAGQPIIEVDKPGDAAILIVAGDAVRTSGPHGQDLSEPVPPGALIAELAMLVEVTHSSTVIARGQVRALRIAREELFRQMEDDHALAEHFVAMLSTRLHKVSEEYRAIDRRLAEAGRHASLN